MDFLSTDDSDVNDIDNDFYVKYVDDEFGERFKLWISYEENEFGDVMWLIWTILIMRLVSPFCGELDVSFIWMTTDHHDVRNFGDECVLISSVLCICLMTDSI